MAISNHPGNHIADTFRAVRDAIAGLDQGKGVTVDQIKNEVAKLDNPDADLLVGHIVGHYGYYTEHNLGYDAHLPTELNPRQVRIIQSGLAKALPQLKRIKNLVSRDGSVDRTVAEAATHRYDGRANWRPAPHNPMILAQNLVRVTMKDLSKLPDPGFDVPAKNDAVFLRSELLAAISMIKPNSQKASTIDVKKISDGFLGDKRSSVRWRAFDSVLGGLAAIAGEPSRRPEQLDAGQAKLASRALGLARRMIVEGSAAIHDDGKLTKTEAQRTVEKLLKSDDSDVTKLAAIVFADVTAAHLG